MNDKSASEQASRCFLEQQAPGVGVESGTSSVLTCADEGEPPVRSQSSELPTGMSHGRYQLHGEIARGGMGVILKGHDTDLGRDLAIKVLLEAHKDKPDVVRRFIEEAQIGGQLQHPGIVPVYELGQFADERPFFSMKLVKGQTLSSLLAQRKDLAEARPRFLGIFQQVCQTLAYAHSRGVIHRDLKPANIMVGAFGEVQVMDWGLAKVLAAAGVADERTALEQQEATSVIRTVPPANGEGVPVLGTHTLAGSVLGTPAYMSPEQALGEVDRLDERSDVFGLGAILCEVLTGKPPYTGKDGPGVLRLASRGKLDDCHARLHACGVEGDLTDLARECLASEPDQRPRHAGVVAERISCYLASVESRLRATEVERAAEAARAEEALHTVALAQAKAMAERRARRWQVGLAVVVVTLTTVAGITAALAAMYQGRLKEDALTAQMQAEAARLDSLDQTYLATRNEIKAMRLARQSGWRSAALGRLRGLAGLGSRNLDRVDLRTEALACLAQRDVRLEARFVNYPIGAWHIQYSPDARILAINDDKNNLVYLQDLETGQALPAIPKSVGYAPFAFHPSGTLAVPRAEGQLAFHPLRPGQPTFPQIAGNGHALNLSFNRAGDRLATAWGTLASGGAGAPGRLFRLTVHETATGAALWAVDLSGLPVRTYKVALALSPDGRSLATTGPGGEVLLYSVGKKEEPIVLGRLGDPLSTIAFHPDGQSLVAAGGTVAVMWDLQRRSEVLRLFAPDERIWDIAYSPDGQLLAGACNNRIVKLWDSRSGRELAAVPSECGANCLSVAFSPRGDRVAAGCGSVSVFAIEGLRECRYETSPTNGVYGLAFDTTRPALLSCGGDRHVRSWDLHDHVAGVLRVTNLNERIPPGVLRFAPGGRQLALGFTRYRDSRPDEDWSVRVWPLDHPNAERRLKGPRKPVLDVAFDLTSKRLAAASADGGLYFWEFETGVLQHRLELTRVKAAGFLDETRLLVAAGNRLVLLSANDGAVIREVSFPSESATFVITPDQKQALVATADGTIHRVRVPELALEQSRMVLAQPSNLALALSPDGGLLAVTTQAGPRTLLIDPRTLEPLAQLPEHDNRITCLAFDHDGRHLALGGAKITLWNLALARAELAQLGLGLGASTSAKDERQELKKAFPQRDPRLPHSPIPPIQPTSVIGDNLARNGKWGEAAKASLAGIAASPQERHRWFIAATRLILAGDVAGYRQLCGRMVEQFHGTTVAEQADSVCKTCLLLPGGVGRAQLPADVLVDAANNDATADQFRRWFHGCAALIALRDNQLEQAVDASKKSLAINKGHYADGALALVVLAMAQHRLAQTDQARKSLAEGTALIPSELATLGSRDFQGPLPVSLTIVNSDWLAAEILRREAALLIHKDAKPSQEPRGQTHFRLGTMLVRQAKTDEAIREFRRAIELAPDNAPPFVHLGWMLFLQGNLDEASTLFHKAIDLDPNLAYAHRLLGHVLLRQGKLKEADSRLSKAIELNPRDGAAKVLQANVQRLLPLLAKLDTFVNGTQKPADNAQRLDLAQLCCYRQRFAAAAHFYADVLTADPKLADLRARHRYNAACAASRAAAGQGEEAAQLDDKARSRLRKQALDWLRADLALWARQLETGPPAERTAVRRTLKHWQQDTDLGSIREKATLDKLPAEERAAFARLWADVAALLEKEEEKVK